MTPGALYVFGVERGLGMQRFTTGMPSIVARVSFDPVLVLRPDGTGAVTDIIVSTTTALAPATITISRDTISRDTISASVPVAVLPFDYTFNPWPKNRLGQNTQAADFAPDTSDFRSTSGLSQQASRSC